MNRKFLCLIAMVFLSPIASAGEKESGGGAILAAEFSKTARKAIELLSLGDQNLDYQEILSEIKNTRVLPVEEICYENPALSSKYCEDAHYDAKNDIILFAFKKWDKMSCTEKLVLSSHEFFRAAGIEGGDYSFSGRFLDHSFVHGVDDEYKSADIYMSIRRKMAVFCEYLYAFSNERRKK